MDFLYYSELTDYIFKENCFHWGTIDRANAFLFLWPELILNEEKTKVINADKFNVPICNKCNKQMKPALVFICHIGNKYYCETCKIKN